MAITPQESTYDFKILFITLAMTNHLELTNKLKHLFKPLSRMQNAEASYNLHFNKEEKKCINPKF